MTTRIRPALVDSAIVGLGAICWMDSARIGWAKPTLGVTTLAWVAALLVRRRYVVAPIVVPLAFALRSVISAPLMQSRPEFLAWLLAAWLLGAGAASRRQLSLGAVAFPASITVIRYRYNTGHPIADVIFVSLLSLASLLLGALAGRHARRVEEQRTGWDQERIESEERARLAVEHERALIAQELRDIIGHCVSVMTVQAGAARALLGDGDRSGAHDAVLRVEDAGHEALADMRRLLGILRKDTTVGPGVSPRGLGGLADVVEKLRKDGLAVVMSVEEPPSRLPFGLEVTCFHVVEDRLEDARSAGATSARVQLRQITGAVTLEVRDDRSPSSSGVLGTRYNEDGVLQVPGGGSAPVEAGLRERVQLYGGTIEVVADSIGGTVLRAHLPLEGAVP